MRKLAVHAGSSNTCSGVYKMNKLFTVLLLRAPMCRASVGSIFAKIIMAGQSFYSKTRIRPYMWHNARDITLCVAAWSDYYF